MQSNIPLKTKPQKKNKKTRPRKCDFWNLQTLKHRALVWARSRFPLFQRAPTHINNKTQKGSKMESFLELFLMCFSRPSQAHLGSQRPPHGPYLGSNMTPKDTQKGSPHAIIFRVIFEVLFKTTLRPTWRPKGLPKWCQT